MQPNNKLCNTVVKYDTNQSYNNNNNNNNNNRFTALCPGLPG